MPNKQPIIIDTDPGIDDALAILLLLNSPEVEVKAITTVAGNKDLQTITDNATTIVQQTGQNIPIYSGAAQPLKKKLQTGQVMGDTGLGNAPRITGAKLNNLAATKLIELVASQPQQITIVAIGPLTNLAQAMKQDPQFVQNLKELVIMGGAIESYGNMNRVAEFNFYLDPEAADLVMAAQCRKTLIPLDRCYEVPLLISDFAKLNESKYGSFINNMVEPYIKNLAQFEGQPGAIVYDALAAYYCLNPQAFQTKLVDLRVETCGTLTRGACVIERRPSVIAQLNVNVVTRIDKKVFTADFLRRLKNN